MMEGDYKKLTLRNGYFISDKLQKKISETTLVFVGCGLASTVAISAARLGFLNFILADGDNVELSNLNRQDFYTDEIGKNKAQVIANRLIQINKEIKVEHINKHLSVSDLEPIVSRGDIIINSADFDEVTYALNRIVSAQGKISISPLNIGFGTVTTVFSKKSVTLEEMTKGIAKSDKDYLINFAKNLRGYKIPKYISTKIIQIFYFIAKKGFFPQNIIAAHTSTVAILHTIIRYLDNKKIKFAPYPVAIDIENIYG